MATKVLDITKEHCPMTFVKTKIELSSLHYEEADTLNAEQIKRDFPVLNQKVNGHDLVWLDNGATTQKPNQVIDKISDYYRTYNSNIHRGAHTLAARATDAYEEAREKVQRFINAASSEEIIFVRGTTEGINLVAQTYGRQYLTPGDEVIVSELDHHANIVPWQRVAQERGATLRAIPTDKNGDLILSELERLITPRTRFVSVGHVNNTFGTINDVRRIIDIAHAHQIPGLTLIGNPKNRVSVVSFVLDGIPVPEVGTLLDKEGIAVRAGHHCAQPALRALGYEMSVRPTFALYNTREDVDKLVMAVKKIIGR